MRERLKPRSSQVSWAGCPRPSRRTITHSVENTKFNSDVILAKLGERLARQYGMTVSRMIRERSPSHAVAEEAADELRRISDFVVSGVGD